MKQTEKTIFTRDNSQCNENEKYQFWLSFENLLVAPPPFFDGINFPKLPSESSDFNSIFSSTEFFITEFSNCTFNGSVSFLKSKFLDNILFKNCNFIGDVNFRNAEFRASVRFSGCNFSDNIEWGNAKFNSHFEIEKSNFDKGLQFESINFNDFLISSIQAKESLIFTSCKFQRSFSVDNSQIKGDARFTDTSFSNQFRLKVNNINQIIIKKVELHDYALISECKGMCLIISKCTQITKTLSLSKSLFENVQFLEVNIIGSLYLDKNRLNQITFIDTSFNGEFEINSDCYKSINFKNSQFSKGRIHRVIALNRKDDRKKMKYPEFGFYEITTMNNLILTSTNLSNAHFHRTDVSEGKFIDCFDSLTRLKIGNEKSNDPEFPIDVTEIADLYRQFKISFENQKDWGLAALAYRSEMVFRKKSIFRKGQSIMDKISGAIIWTIHTIYDGLSGYNQSAVRPLLILLGTITAGSFYYAYGEGNSFNDGLQMSFGASFPYLIKVAEELTYDVWWIKLIQTFLSSILIAFFIIALRKKFKQ